MKIWAWNRRADSPALICQVIAVTWLASAFAIGVEDTGNTPGERGSSHEKDEQLCENAQATQGFSAVQHGMHQTKIVGMQEAEDFSKLEEIENRHMEKSLQAKTECTADFGETTVCCGQRGDWYAEKHHLPNLVRNCPGNEPVCHDYKEYHRMGICKKAQNECSADFGGTKACCGQRGDWYAEKHQFPNNVRSCPRDEPICHDYKEYHRMGRCKAKVTAKKIPESDPESFLMLGWAPPKGTGASVSLQPLSQLFEYTSSDVFRKTDADSNDKYTAFETLEKEAKQLALSMSAKGRYKAFSGSVSASATLSDSSQVAKMRADKSHIVLKFYVQVAVAYPHKHLKPDVKNYLLTETPEKIVSKYGEFYATKIIFGATWNSLFTKKKTHTDTKEDFKAEAKAKWDSLVAEAGIEGTVTAHTGREGSAEEIFMTNAAKGGDPTILFGLTKSNVQQKTDEWRRSINDNNVVPLRFGAENELVPIWDLINEINPDKGMEVKSYLEGEWEKRFSGLSRIDGYDTATSDWSNAGCWQNNPRVWSHKPGVNAIGRVGYQACQRKAFDREADFFSMEDGDYCWIHSEIDLIDEKPAMRNCRKGGLPNVNHVYEWVVKQSPTYKKYWKSIGCWKNTGANRGCIGCWSADQGLNRIGFDRCMEEAEKRHLKFFSIEDGINHGGWCWLHSESSKISKPPDWPDCDWEIGNIGVTNVYEFK